ncbi:MAG TPA: SDR family NAD(P)-dependent oxidoreductase [Microbacteriaceae bacterium]|nr:SDR family NAD(P)-dependent oxidoreductase [Microbacteriaceae bacterium]
MTAVAGRVAVVTGGASGIGRGIAEALLEAGATVVIADIQPDALAAAAAELGVTGVQVDVTDAGSVEALRDAVLAEHGRVDIVCLNAGIGPAGLMRDLTRADWEWILGVNLWGVINGVQAFLPVLESNADGGHIEITGSMSSFVSMPTIGSYTVTKFGAVAIAETLAIELADAGSEVHVSLLAPGPVRTNIGASSRNRPDSLRGGLADVDVASGIASGMRWIDPITAGRITVRAIEANDLYVPTHPELWAPIEARHEAIRAAYAKYPIWDES